jgi:replicative DNA helicase
MSTVNCAKQAVRVFCSYSHKDERFKNALEEHLAIYKRTGLIELWCDRRITPGDAWNHEILTELRGAEVILLLISPSFIASDFCHEVELSIAMERYELGLANVVPICIRPVVWQGSAFDKLQCLPKDALAVTEWPNEDQVWKQIATSLRPILETALLRQVFRHADRVKPEKAIP